MVCYCILNDNSYREFFLVQSDISEEDMDRYAQELLLATNKPQQRLQIENPCSKHHHLTNLNLLKQQQQPNGEDASDTDYIPSDDETESPKHSEQILCTSSIISHPLKLNQRSLHMLDENAINKIGLFNENGELHVDAIKILEAERSQRAKDAKNKQFRRRRATSDSRAFEKRKFVVPECPSGDLSDIKSESELEIIDNGSKDNVGVIKMISGLKGNRKI